MQNDKKKLIHLVTKIKIIIFVIFMRSMSKLSLLDLSLDHIFHHNSNLNEIPELRDELLDLFLHDDNVDKEDGIDSLAAIGIIVPHTPEIPPLFT